LWFLLLVSHNGNCFQGLSYGDGSVSGKEYLDTITLNSDLVIKVQSIGVADNGDDAGLRGDLDGILGVGPIDLTEGTVNNTYEVPTVMDNLYAQHSINSEVLGVFFAPASATDTTGELTFGNYDISKITGDINYVPITLTYPANNYWGIDQSISYGLTSILRETAGIVDTGTTLILIAAGMSPRVCQRKSTHTSLKMPSKNIKLRQVPPLIPLLAC